MKSDGNALPDLPPNWVWAAASVVCTKIQDGTHFSPKNQSRQGTYRYITAKNVRPSGLDLSDVTFLEEADHRAIYARCDPKLGDVLLVKDGVNTCDAAVNTLHEEISILSSVCMLRPDTAVLNAQFLRYFLQSPTGYRLLTGQMTGTAIKRIVLHRIKDTPVPIAPLPEQHRIVAAIEQQFTRLDAAVADLQQARAKLKRYRAAVLAAACSGRLVPTEAELARTEGREYESGDRLLERILERRRAAAKVRLKDSPWPTGDGLPTLPDGWIWTALYQLLVFLRNGLSTKPDAETGTPILRISAVRPLSVNFSDVRYLSTSVDVLADYVLTTDDLLFTRYNGNPALVGVCGTVRGVPRPTVHPDKIIRGKVVADLSLPRFLEVALNVGFSRSFLAGRVRTTAGQSGISGSDVRSMPVPLPPLAEQHRIVAEVERRLSVVDEMEATVTANLKRAERMRQAILRRAFSGQLVTQNTAGNPSFGIEIEGSNTRGTPLGTAGTEPSLRPTYSGWYTAE